MCCFFGPGATFDQTASTRAAPPLAVENTLVFARRSGENEQIIAYQMALRTADDVVMVLPLPVGSRDEQRAVQFVNLEKCGDLLTALSWMLPVWVPPYEPPEETYDGLCLDQIATKPRLEVQKVGSYEASFVPTIADFERLDPRFRVDPELWAELGDYSDWGFAVFQLRDIVRGKTTPVHPMALRFVTRHPESLFFPTVHVHDGSVHPTADFDHLLFFQAESSRRSKERWFVDGLEVADSIGVPESRIGRIRWGGEESAERLLRYVSDAQSARDVIDPDLILKAFGMKGTLPNRDTWLHFEAPWQ